ncbi:MAG: enoyl-CoA hydratase [Bryobacteraceae bacterium]
MSGKILTSIEHAVGTLTIHNPDRHNSMSLHMWKDAAAALDAFAGESHVRVVVLTGAGTKSFASGADISEFEKVRADAKGAEEYDVALDRFWNTLANHPKPTIAKINGYCIGGGVNIAACCDLRICTEASRFAVPAARLGLGYGTATVRRLMHLVGPQFASEILLTARQFTAAEAFHMRLVNHVVAEAEIEAYVAKLVETIAQNAPLTMNAAKCAIHELLKDPTQQDLAACDALVTKCFDSEDYQEGRRAFLEKRKPEFKGR